LVLIKNSNIKTSVTPKEVPAAKTPEVKEIVPEPEVVIEPKVVVKPEPPKPEIEPVVEIAISNESQEPIPPIVDEVILPEEKKHGFKVVGKIDLSAGNYKTKPDKKQKDQPKKDLAKPNTTKVEQSEEAKPVLPEPVAELVETAEPIPVVTEEVIKEVAPVEEIVVQAEDTFPELEPVAEIEAITLETIPAETEPEVLTNPVSEEKEVMKPNYEKLQGLKVLGKIELPVNQPKDKRPVASSDGSHDAKKKRKRKVLPVLGDKPKRPDGNNTGGNNSNNNNNRNNQRNNNNNNRPGVRKPGENEAPKEITDKQVQDKLKQTLAKLQANKNVGVNRAKNRRQKRDVHAKYREDELREKEAENRILKVTEFISANELATMMDVSVNEIITACFSLGMMVSINQRLDAETIAIIAEEFGFETQFVDAETQESIEEEIDEDGSQLPRAPIVTVMGHVDHGKTSLLDYVRKANVIAGEAGGITQHIGAYEVMLEDSRKITFLDTPGHEAFTAMRARGAKLTDVAIIVIAADDSVMPQTREAIAHAQAASVPIVFAINKIDKPGANPEKVREQLAAMDILVEEWGGKYQSQEISAKGGINIPLLLDKVLLEAEMLDLKANPNKRAIGSVIESQLDKGRGIVVTLMVQAGTMKVGDPIIAGVHAGKVKAMFNERGKKIDKAGPSTPVTILGFSGAPQAGDRFQVTVNDAEAKEISNKRQQLLREQGLRTKKHITLDEIGRRLAIGNFKELNLIIKGDVDGSVEALSDAMLKLSTPEIQVNVIHKSVGQISESDILLASASDAIVIGFQVRPSSQAKKLAENEGIEVKYYSIIYKAIEEIKDAMEGLLEPEIEERETATVEVREVFKITKVGTVAGCYVTSGKIFRNNKIRLVREGVVVHSGELESLKRFKDDVKDVNYGYECGISIKNWSDIQEGDIIESYEIVEIKRKLK
jgi:translation initiation factor IF-2